jgi:hypothetical protein
MAGCPAWLACCILVVGTLAQRLALVPTGHCTDNGLKLASLCGRRPTRRAKAKPAALTGLWVKPPNRRRLVCRPIRAWFRCVDRRPATLCSPQCTPWGRTRVSSVPRTVETAAEHPQPGRDEDRSASQSASRWKLRRDSPQRHGMGNWTSAARLRDGNFLAQWKHAALQLLEDRGCRNVSVSVCVCWQGCEHASNCHSPAQHGWTPSPSRSLWCGVVGVVCRNTPQNP